MKENSILKIKVLSYREGNGGYISFDDTLRDYWDRSSTISDLLNRFVCPSPYDSIAVIHIVRF